jgi:hypothetical protein
LISWFILFFLFIICRKQHKIDVNMLDIVV